MRADEHYYVQQLTDSIFLIRERLSIDKKSSLNDPLIRSFENRHDAYAYVDNLNEVQRKFDESNGH